MTAIIAKSAGATAIGMLITALAIAPSFGEETRPFDRTITVDIVYSPSGLRTEDERDETLVNSDSVVQALGQFKITNNDHFFDLEIVEAATLKADGRRLDVPPAQIFATKGTSEGAALFDADASVHVVPFPDLGVGDRRLVHIRRHEKTQKIPGTIFQAYFFPRTSGAPILDISVEAPDSLHLQVAERALTHSETLIAGGRRFAWHVEPQERRAIEPLAVAAIDSAPRILLSNSADWASFGRIYAEQLGRAAEPEATVRAKADEITQGVEDRREIARALFDWTARNIRYFDVVLGAGGWFPHAPASILSLRYGDCKDHATLLRALLAAKGIDSEPVLINLAGIYGDYGLPVPQFDHMIVYVPEFDRYLDPTDPTSTFDNLPPSLRDKPVLRIGAQGGIAARTPLNTPEAALFTLTADITIDAAGRATGTSTQVGRGPTAEYLRRSAQRIASLGAGEIAAKTLLAQHWHGTGGFTAPSFVDHSDPYRIDATFRLDRPFFGASEEPNALPTGPRLFERPVATLLRGLREKWVDPFVCGIPVTYVERLRMSWPAGVALKRVPKSVDVVSGFVSYRATYTASALGLEVERTYRFAPAHAFCLPADITAAAAALGAAERDLSFRLAFDSDAKAGPAADTADPGLAQPEQ